jgi:hypothetical protein
MSAPESMVERAAKAICCPSGKCHTEAVKAGEHGKYLTDLPCYSLSPDVRESAREAIGLVVDQCAKYCEAHVGAYPPYSEARSICRRLGRVIRALAGPSSESVIAKLKARNTVTG